MALQAECKLTRDSRSASFVLSTFIDKKDKKIKKDKKWKKDKKCLNTKKDNR